MNWKPTTEGEVWDDINDAYERMSLEQQRIWDVIKILPEKWTQEPWGDLGEGFWVVAIIGNTVIWYNDIEDGWNRSTYSQFGRIESYHCNQDNLEWQVQNVIDHWNNGQDTAGYSASPQPIT